MKYIKNTYPLLQSTQLYCADAGELYLYQPKPQTMAINKLALIRYKTIDECLRNRYRKWTLDALIEKVSSVLYEMEGITSGVSKRTVQMDIQVMRSDKLGYNAPIIVVDKCYYAYSDSEYSIFRAPLNPSDVEKMKEVVFVLKQFNGFRYFEEMSDMIARLENNLYKNIPQGRNYIQLENNRQLKGLEHITPLYQAILHKRPLLIEYKSFKATAAQEQVYYPYLLKEYRNRWFVITRAKKGKLLLTMALDRIVSFQELPKEPFVDYDGIDLDIYYDEVLGVTRTEKDKPQKVLLWIDQYHTPYVQTKPLHHSQHILKNDENGMLVSIDVIVNFELEREILGFGEHMRVVAPRALQTNIQKRLEKAREAYQ
ncbi:helix-turn-helix transcriptional regulator [Paraflavitalea pollutisoli]|uniref:helix-turn-helix transcriptional regulator n=1 Tax=Paraflavitalea pollutisoli TaxID=3034143 RepID=UPI0023EC28D7|nr:WYL domain-containing protein [Paraflavitalea sp. H1-2-19X]